MKKIKPDWQVFERDSNVWLATVQGREEAIKAIHKLKKKYPHIEFSAKEVKK